MRRTLSVSVGIVLSARACDPSYLAGARLLAMQRGQFAQARRHAAVQCQLRVDAGVLRRARRHAGEQLDGFVRCAHRKDTEFSFGCGGHHVVTQHQLVHVGGRNQNALLAAQAARLADVEEAFDLFVDPADRPARAELVDRAGDRQALLDRRVGERREQGAQLGERGAVALDRP